MSGAGALKMRVRLSNDKYEDKLIKKIDNKFKDRAASKLGARSTVVRRNAEGKMVEVSRER